MRIEFVPANIVCPRHPTVDLTTLVRDALAVEADAISFGVAPSGGIFRRLRQPTAPDGSLRPFLSIVTCPGTDSTNWHKVSLSGRFRYYD